MTIDEIRDRVEAKHLEALHALLVLEQYLSDEDQPVQANDAHSPSPARRYKKNGGSISSRVLAAIGHEWTSTSKIKEETDLTVKQVRGVLNAPRYKGTLDRREVNGHAEYRTKQGG